MTFGDSAIEQSIELNNFHTDMATWLTYLIITALLLAAELVYFRIADKCNITEQVTITAGTPDCGMSVEAGRWHRLVCHESGTVIFEAKDGAYEPIGGEDILNL